MAETKEDKDAPEETPPAGRPTLEDVPEAKDVSSEEEATKAKETSTPADTPEKSEPIGSPRKVPDPQRKSVDTQRKSTDMTRTSLSRLSRQSIAHQSSLFRPSTTAFFRPSGGLERRSVAGFRGQFFNEALARMSQTPAGWKVDDTAELVQAVEEDQQIADGTLEERVDEETKARRKLQLTKLEEGELLNKLERESLAGAALEGGVQTYLRRVKERLNQAGYDLPSIEVRYKELIVEMDALVGSGSLPTLINGAKSMAFGIANTLTFGKLGLGQGAKRPLRVLKALTGVLRASTCSVVLGQPGAGKTSYLRTLSGRLTTYPSPRTLVNGEITYNGATFDEFEVLKTAAYVDEREIHYAHLTVRETFQFSAKCLGQGALPRLLKEIRDKESGGVPIGDNYNSIEEAIFLAAAEGRDDLYVELIIKLLRLTPAADTIIGDGLTRGCSGGEKRRVTSGEFLVGPFHCFFMDEISNGLDGPGTFAICNALCEYAHLWHATFVISLQQPEPLCYNLFDEIIVMAEGRELFHGPREEVMPYFNGIGFYMPARKETADFLQELASPKDQGVLRLAAPDGDSRWGKYAPPRILEKEWKESSVFDKHIADKLAEPILPDPNDVALARDRYVLTDSQYLALLFQRYIVLEAREWLILVYRFIQSTLMAIVVGAFVASKTTFTLLDGMQMMGVLYFSLMYMILDSVPVVAITFERKRVFLKQRDNLFFPAWAFAWPMTFIEVPVLLVQVILYCVIQYFWVGFAGTAGQFFAFLAVHFFILTFADSLYRIIGAASPSLTVGNNLASFLLLIILATSGFTIYRLDMHPWWIWALWINPYAWGIRSLAINEMHSSQWFISAPPYTGFLEAWFIPYQNHGNLGKYVLVEYQLQTHYWWVWGGIAFIAIVWAVFMFIPPLVFSWLPEPRKQLIISDTNPFDPEASVSVKIGNGANGAAPGGDAAPVPAAPRPEGEGALPFEKMALVFKDVDYYVPKPGNPSEELQLLKKIWGAFRPGVLTALMGASGAGKTTLMDLIAGRKSVGRIEGLIALNGHPKDQNTFARVMGYVEQFDIHSPKLTIKESCQFAGATRLDRSIPMARKMAFVEEQMDTVELSPLAGMIVGVPGESGLSHEQRKRLTIAVELVANPSVIFMDEPTTGLDARAALIVMRVVRNIANSGRTVTCTIHQPSTEIFENFDQLLMMKRGGWMVYFGDIGRHSSALIKHFELFPEVPRFAQGMNPSSWALDITSGNIPGMPDFAEVYTSSELHKANMDLIEELSTPPPGSAPLSFQYAYAASMPTQFIWLLKKYFWTYWRDPDYNLWRYVMTVLISLVLGTLYLGIGWTDTWDYIRLVESFGAVYLGAMFLGTQNAFSVQPLISYERTVYYREKAARTYNALPYVMAETIVEIPYVLVQALLYSAIIYFLVNWASGAGSFFFFFFFNFLSLLAFTYSGMLLVHITPNVQLASVLASGVYGFWKLWAGFIIPYNSFSNFFVWGFWLNPLTYVVYAITMWQYGELYEPIYFGGSFQSIRAWLDGYYGYKHSFMWVNAAILLGLCAFFRVGSYLAVAFLNFQKR